MERKKAAEERRRLEEEKAKVRTEAHPRAPAPSSPSLPPSPLNHHPNTTHDTVSLSRPRT